MAGHQVLHRCLFFVALISVFHMLLEVVCSSPGHLPTKPFLRPTQLAQKYSNGLHGVPKAIKLCEVVGFDETSIGSQVLSEIFPSASPSTEVLTSSWDDPNIYANNVLLYVTKLQQRGESRRILHKVQQAIDHSLQSSIPVKVTILLQGKPDFAQRLLCQEIDLMTSLGNSVNSAQFPMIEVTYQQHDVNIPLSSFDVDSRLVSLNAQSFKSIINRASVPSQSLSQLIPDLIKSSHLPSEADALGNVEALLISFQQQLDNDLNKIATLRLARNVSSIHEVVRDTIEKVNAIYYAGNKKWIDELLLSSSNGLIADRVRSIVYRSLSNWLFQILDLLRRDHVRRFKQRIAKVSPKAPLKVYFRTLISNTVKEHFTNVEVLKKGNLLVKVHSIINELSVDPILSL